MAPDQIVLVNMCGRGDKDMGTLSQVLGFDLGMEVAPPVAKA
jgi:tryptophan synthase beta subunit